MATLPATITTGSYPGAQHNYCGPFIDGNGNLYVILIGDVDDHTLECWKSSNGGETWSEQDSTNNPDHTGTGQVYSIDVFQDGTRLHVASFETSLEDVYYHTFDTSDASSNQDTWTEVDTLVAGYTDTTSEWSVSIIVNGDGDRFIHSSGDDSTYYSTRECTEYHYNTGSGWNTKNAMGDTDSDNVLGPVGLGENDKIHVVWKEEVNNRYMHSSLTDVDATPSADESLGSYTTSGFNYVNARKIVYYDASGVERMTFVALASDDTPYSTIIDDDGTPDTAEQVTTTTVHRGSANYHSAAMCLCVDAENDTVYLVFADATTQDVYLIKNTNDGGWTGETEIWDAVTCDLLCANIYINKDGAKVIGYVIDDGGPEGTTKYNEYVLEEAIPDISVSDGVSVADSPTVEVPLGISIVSDDPDRKVRGVKITS